MTEIQDQFAGLSKLEKEAIIQVGENGLDMRYVHEVLCEYVVRFPSQDIIMDISRTDIDDPITYIASFYIRKESEPARS